MLPTLTVPPGALEPLLFFVVLAPPPLELFPLSSLPHPAATSAHTAIRASSSLAAAPRLVLSLPIICFSSAVERTDTSVAHSWRPGASRASPPLPRAGSSPGLVYQSIV